MLITGTVILAALGMAALASIWSSADEKVTAVASAQSAPKGSGQRASGISVTSADPSVAVAWPDLPASITTETPEAGSTAANRNTSLRETYSASQKEDIVSCNGPAYISGLRPRQPDVSLRPPRKARASRLPTGKAIGCRWRAIGSAVGSDRDFLRRMSRNISYGFMAGPFGRFACHERSREELPRR